MSSVPLSPNLQNFLSKAEEGNPTISLSRAEEAFTRLKSSTLQEPDKPFVMTTSTPHNPSAPYDVVIVGGTLGIFYATALQALGWRVVVIERGPVKGRSQEWNISRDELASLLNNHVVDQHQLEHAIVTEFVKPGRVGFVMRDGSKCELGVQGVLNVGVAPDRLVASARKNFESLGGVVSEFCTVNAVQVGSDAVRVVLKQGKVAVQGSLGAGGTGIVAEAEGPEGEEHIDARVLVDAMGAFSPIAAQSRRYRKPDGVCITVGSCMKGDWAQNETGDLIYSFQPINKQRSAQYFWEAFPVGREDDARTTYMFSYGPCDERRQGLTEALEDYLKDLPVYQGVDVDSMTVKRVLFGFFPTYFRDSPTNIAFDRILPVGDAGGLQSPISFGGFGCCLRHLSRICGALDEALRQRDDTLLKRSKLQMLQWYLPSLLVAGLFNKAMSVQPGQTTAGPLLDEYGINEVLWSNMKAMADLGERVQRPFLQDVVTAGGLSKTLAAMAINNPLLALKMTAFLGPSEILSWSRHYLALIFYAASLPLLQFLRGALSQSGTLTKHQRFLLNRMIDAAVYGSGKDAEHQFD